jgi:hypothetical protein
MITVYLNEKNEILNSMNDRSKVIDEDTLYFNQCKDSKVKIFSCQKQ